MLCLSFAVFANAANENANWPTKDIQVLIPANPGGGTDASFRTLAPAVSEKLGVNVALVNMNGGAGSLANFEIMDHEPDGYYALWHHYDTILLTMKGMTDKRYDEYLDIVCVLPYKGGEVLAYTNQKTGFTSWKDVVDYAKANPGKLVWAVEAGGWSHLYAAGICKACGIDVNLVDYGSASERMVGLLGGNVDVLLDSSSRLKEYPDQIIPLGACADNRKAECPDVPTIKEQGFNIQPYINFLFYAVPKGTPSIAINKTADAIAEALKTPEWEAYAQKKAMTSYEFLTGAEATKYLKDFEETYKDSISLIIAK